MQRFAYSVNLFLLRCFCKQPQVVVFAKQFLGEANYNKAAAVPQGPAHYCSKIVGRLWGSLRTCWGVNGSGGHILLEYSGVWSL